MIAMLVGGFIPALQAAENDTTQNPDTQLPDLEFLEFLGQFETDEGEWISPGNLMAEEFADLLEVAENIEAQANIETSTDNQ